VVVRLPVHEIEESLLGAFRGGDPVRVLLRAPTGSGKSTVVPPLLVDAGVAGGRIMVIEPRRMAARMLARWVARQRGERVGGEIGHAVRFDTSYGCSMNFMSGDWREMWPWHDASICRMA